MNTLLKITTFCMLPTLLSCNFDKGVVLTELSRNANEIELGAAKNVEAFVMVDFGELYIGTGTQKLVQAEFEYNFPEFSYFMDYAERDDRGRLKIYQESNNKDWVFNKRGKDLKNRWNINLNSSIAFDLNAELKAGFASLDLEDSKVNRLVMDCGAGEVSMRLGSSALEYLNVNAKVGKVSIDFSGDWNQNLEAKIEGGVGSIELIIPKNLNVEIRATSKIGNVDAPTFTKSGSLITQNSDSENAKTLFLTIRTTVGQISVKSSEN